MKRSFSVIVSALTVISLVFLAGGCMSVPHVSLEGKSVLYLTKVSSGELTETDKTIIAHLESLGMVVTPMNAKESKADDAQGYDLVYVSEVVSSSHVGNKFKDVAVPMVSTEHYIADDMGFAEPEEGKGYGKAEYAYKELVIKDPSHLLAAGLSGTVQIYTDYGSVGFSRPQGEVQVVAVAPDDESMVLIYGYEKGSKDMHGDVVPARRVFSFLFEGMESLLTDEGWKLFDAAFMWALEGSE
ncbi:hypothetical protein [Spirochaeta thermophila]|uniref:Putative transmembrane lipoprotein n=1 Tax=Winmispira thermophila (strain ATCC 49972 / DSM 6192 / RI 19.B1) TaxID=665571 RepID=E0RPR5_WINT6|nr:hypothetical protein [Spirochaeta thermophila]ADN01379.1 putative transmembrane lipoprotein [Spirochaeta thermophila DSM 6192]